MASSSRATTPTSFNKAFAAGLKVSPWRIITSSLRVALRSASGSDRNTLDADTASAGNKVTPKPCSTKASSDVVLRTVRGAPAISESTAGALMREHRPLAPAQRPIQCCEAMGGRANEDEWIFEQPFGGEPLRRLR